MLNVLYGPEGLIGPNDKDKRELSRWPHVTWRSLSL